MYYYVDQSQDKFENDAYGINLNKLSAIGFH